MLTINIDVTSNVEEALEGKAEALIAGVRAEMNHATVNLLGYIESEKLSGQVLHQRTGNLKAGGYTEVVPGTGGITGFVGFRGVKYAAIHNYGGSIDIPEVTGKLMVFSVKGGFRSSLYGYAGDTVFTMRHRAFTVHMPKRNYLESSATEQEPVIREGFRVAVAEAVKDA